MRRYSTWSDLREAMPSDLPFAIREAILGNVVVGNFTDHFALILAYKISEKLNQIRNGQQFDLFEGV